MSAQVPLEQRLTDLQAQIDQLSLTLQFWRQTQDHLQPMERRLARLTEECADVLDRWKATGDRHAQAVDELETRLVGWGEVEARLQQDTSVRLRDLERSIEHEWAALRQLHEEPVKALREQAAALTEVCTAAAGSAQTSLERAEARLALLEQELHRKMDEVTLELRGAVAQLRLQGGTMALNTAAAPWPLEGVARLHDQLRETASGVPAPDDSRGPVVLPRLVGRRDAANVAFDLHDWQPDRAPSADRSSSRDQTSFADEAPAARAAGERGGRVLLTFLAVALVGALVFAGFLYRQAGSAAETAVEAREEAQRVAADADRRLRETRDQAAQQLADARAATMNAQIVSDVLAAPDLLRFNLVGSDGTTRASAQLLLSRTRGLVFGGSRLPQPPATSAYQIWLLTGAEPVSAGTFVPDSSGRATVTIENPSLPPRVVGVLVTTEPASGSEAPTGPVLLARAP